MLASLILYPAWLNVGDRAWLLRTAALVGLIRVLEPGDRSRLEGQADPAQNTGRVVDRPFDGTVRPEPVGSLSSASERAPALAGRLSQPEVTAQS
jgi:hypothetical protein